MSTNTINVAVVENYLLDLQQTICTALEAVDGKALFLKDHWQKAHNGGYGRTYIMNNGGVFEAAGVNFSLVKGQNMPESASASRPELAGRNFTALGISLVLHPHNPFVPTVHMNVRFFVAFATAKNPIWWFGGGYDLTPYYGFKEDCIHWYKNAKQACEPFGREIYPKYKKWCDDYFYLKHRREPRGIGGLFFDDLSRGGFLHCFGLTKSIANSFLSGYLPIVDKHKNKPYTPKNKAWQAYRRGRYVEFNLIYDRGTLFGLQSGGRTESILMSLPPVVNWRYQYQPAKNSQEAQLYRDFLIPKDWI